MLRLVEIFPDQFGVVYPENIIGSLKSLTKFQDKNAYGQVSLAAENLIRQSMMPGFTDRIQQFSLELLNQDVDLFKLSHSVTLTAGVNLLTHLFKDEYPAVRALSIEVYVRQIYRAHRIIDRSVDEKNGRIQCRHNIYCIPRNIIETETCAPTDRSRRKRYRCNGRYSLSAATREIV